MFLLCWGWIRCFAYVRTLLYKYVGDARAGRGLLQHRPLFAPSRVISAGANPLPLRCEFAARGGLASSPTTLWVEEWWNPTSSWVMRRGKLFVGRRRFGGALYFFPVFLQDGWGRRVTCMRHTPARISRPSVGRRWGRAHRFFRALSVYKPGTPGAGGGLWPVVW